MEHFDHAKCVPFTVLAAVQALNADPSNVLKLTARPIILSELLKPRAVFSENSCAVTAGVSVFVKSKGDVANDK